MWPANLWLHDISATASEHHAVTGDEMAEALKAIGWTSGELARRLDIRADTVQSWLIGRRPIPPNVERWLHQVRASLSTAPQWPDGWR